MSDLNTITVMNFTENVSLDDVSLEVAQDYRDSHESQIVAIYSISPAGQTVLIGESSARFAARTRVALPAGKGYSSV